MLKKIRLLFLGLVVIAGSACVTPTHASSAQSVVVAYVQAAGPTGAKEELVVLHNNSTVEVDITDWCLVNKAAVAFGCFAAEVEAGYETRFILPPYRAATVASYEYLTASSMSDDAVSLAYEITNQSSGSIVGSADTITLVNTEGEVVDSRTWVSPLSSGKAWERLKIMSAPDIYATGNDTIDWSVVNWKAIPEDGIELRLVEVEDEDGAADGSDDESQLPEVPLSPIILSEIFPNAKGADAGKEFIELHNTSATETVLLDGLRLRIGLESAKWYSLPNGLSVPAGGYIALSDADLGFTLVNTHGGVQLYDGDTPVGERVEYTSPKDDAAWALINGVWQYTNYATPGAANRESQRETRSESSSAAFTRKPCAANQFRNPATGRCKLIASANKAPAPCKAGQIRNPATNRCRTIATVKTPASCKEGQERNPETNRCRNIKKMTTAGHGVKGVQATAGAQLNWYYWAAIIGIITLVAGYAVWEWRQELRGIWRRIAGVFAKK